MYISDLTFYVYLMPLFIVFFFFFFWSGDSSDTGNVLSFFQAFIIPLFR